jgi:hypothetical protein
MDAFVSDNKEQIESGQDRRAHIAICEERFAPII